MDSTNSSQDEDIEDKRIVKCNISSDNGDKLQINDVFKKQAMNGIFDCWLKENKVPQNIISIEDWCNRITSCGDGYEMIVEIIFDDKNDIEKVFIGHEIGYDESGTNYSWQINMTWLSKKFIRKMDSTLGVGDKFHNFIKEYFNNFEDKINIRFSIPSVKILLPELF